MNQIILGLLIMIFFITNPSFAANKWKGVIPKTAKNSQKWRQLIVELEKRELNFGALAGAARLLILFSDLKSKDFAYRSILRIIDKGYPHDVLALFISGDLQLEEKKDEYSNSYNLNKAIINERHGIRKWSKHYFEKISKEDSAKFMLYASVEAFGRKNLGEAEVYPRTLLSKDLPVEKLPLVRKAARTLARILFQQEKYEKFNI